VDRRSFLHLSALGLAVPVIGACGGDEGPGAKTSTTPSELVPSASASCDATTPLADIGCGAARGLQVIPAEAEVVVGASRLALGLLEADNTPLTESTVKVYAGRDQDKPPEITADAVWLREGSIAAKGLYSSGLRFPTAGAWLVAAVATTPEGARLAGGTTVTVKTTSASPLPGQPAISVPTPTTADPRGADPVCSRRPQPCSMHTVSLDAALRNGRPTVVTFSAPSFCLTETCGPVVEVVEAASKESPGLNFIHVEAYVAPKTPPYPLSPVLKAWKFTSEPWTYFIDARGVVRDRLSGGIGPEDVRSRVAALKG
jgi:hypothetical protein